MHSLIDYPNLLMIALRNDVCIFNRTKDLVETSCCVSKDHHGKIKLPDPVVKADFTVRGNGFCNL